MMAMSEKFGASRLAIRNMGLEEDASSNTVNTNLFSFNSPISLLPLILLD